MSVEQIETVYRMVHDLVLSEYNPRRMDDAQYHQLRESVSRFGVVDPIIINTHPDRRNVVIGGHQRLRVARDLGIERVPCVELELSLDRERELNIRLNKNQGEWDWDLLADLFETEELLLWGFDEDELPTLRTEQLEERKEVSRPYRRAHVLVSFPPDTAPQVKPHIDALSKIDGVEIDQSAN